MTIFSDDPALCCAHMPAAVIQGILGRNSIRESARARLLPCGARGPDRDGCIFSPSLVYGTGLLYLGDPCSICNTEETSTIWSRGLVNDAWDDEEDSSTNENFQCVAWSALHASKHVFHCLASLANPIMLSLILLRVKTQK